MTFQKEAASSAKTKESGFAETVKTVIFAVLIAFGVRTFAFEPFNIPSGSMIPTLLIGDYLFVSKYSYGYSRYSFPFGPNIFSGRVWAKEPERGDVVVFKLPRDNDTDYIKRVIGLPGVPQRASLVFDSPTIARVDGSNQTPLAAAKHVELHGRIAEGSSSDHPVIETLLQINGGNVQQTYPLLAQPFDADIEARISGLKDFSAKPWPQRFREIQAAGGHVEIEKSRIQQGDVIAVAAGSLSLDDQGRIEGELQMTVVGIEKVISSLGIEKLLEEGVPQSTLDRVAPGVKTEDVNNLFGALDRAIPGLGKVIKQNAGVGLAAGVNALGKETTLEGKPARAFPLRFVDGAVFLGPLKVAQVPPLF